MANTITYGKNGIEIVFDGATAWDSSTVFPSGIPLASIEMKPAATDNVLTVREDASATGRKVFATKAADAYDNKIKYFNMERSRRLYKLYVVGNEATATVVMLIEFE